MNIGVLFTGIAYGKKERDWHDSIDGLNEMLLDPFKANHKVKTYFTTYRHKHQGELINALNPAKCQIFSYEGRGQIQTYIKSLEMLQGEPLDFIVSTRFDIAFAKPVAEMDIDYSKFNFLFREKDFWISGYEFTTDVLFLFPMRYLQTLIDALYYLMANPPRPCYDMHGTYKKVKGRIGDENTHFLIDGFYYTHENQFFKLLRRGL